MCSTKQIRQTLKAELEPHHQSHTIQSFNKNCSRINTFICLTLRNKAGVMCQETFQKIKRHAKILGFPQSFLRKSQSELNQFCKTQDFLVMLRQHIHTFLNHLIFEQFNINRVNKKVCVPDILQCYIQNNDLVEEDKHNSR